MDVQRDIHVVWVLCAIHYIQNARCNAERSHPMSRLERKSRSAKSSDMLDLTISVFVEQSRGCWCNVHDISMQRDICGLKHATWHLWFEFLMQFIVFRMFTAMQRGLIRCLVWSAKVDMRDLIISFFVEESRGSWSLCLLVVTEKHLAIFTYLLLVPIVEKQTSHG